MTSRRESRDGGNPDGGDPALAPTQDSGRSVAAVTVRVGKGNPVPVAIEELEPTGPLAGAILGGRYRLIEELGHGGFGTVFRAYDLVADEEVALKLLDPGLGRSPGAVLRLQRELRAARRVTHPGVVRTHDLIDLGDRLALSMEMIEGETLHARLCRSPGLAPEELRALAVDLARALAAAHRVEVVHRDLKPANVILRRGSGRATITDFGVSRIEAGPQLPDDETPARDGAIVGTPRYMAPEQLAGRDGVGPAADVFACGVVLFEAATGHVPHDPGGDDVALLAERRLREPAPSLATARPDVDPELCLIIDRCLARAPADRFPSGVELAVALGERPDAEPAPRTGIIRLARRRGRRWLLAVAALGAAAAAAAAVAWSRGVLPRQDRLVTVTAANAGAPADAWLAPVLQRMAARRLADGAVRYRVAPASARGNVGLQLTVRRVPAGVEVGAALGPARGRRTDLGVVRAPSLAQALDRTLGPVAARLDADQPEREPDERERHDMALLGATSFAAHRLYRHAIYDFFSTVFGDTAAAVRHVEAAIRLDPAWPRLYVLLAYMQGGVTSQAQATLRRGRAAIGLDGRDPRGRRLLTALELQGQGRLGEAAKLATAAWQEAPGDVLACYAHMVLAAVRQRPDDVIASSRQLFEARPDLQFGADLIGALREAGRDEETPAVVATWLQRAPDSEQALTARVALDVKQGRLDDAERHGRDLLLVHGEATHRLATLCDVLIASGRTIEARVVADRLLRGGARERSLARYRLGAIGILEGRFAAAYESLGQAAVEARPFGLESESVQILQALLSLAAAAGHRDDAAAHLDALVEVTRELGFKDQEAAFRYERDLMRARPGACPDLEAAAAALPVGPRRSAVRREMLRAAAEAGCARCADVVRAGRAATERLHSSLFRFAVCAEGEGELRLAAEAFAQVRVFQTTALQVVSFPSPYHSVLANYHLGRIHERLGEREAARSDYQQLLALWGHADRPVPEVAEARLALARLR